MPGDMGIRFSKLVRSGYHRPYVVIDYLLGQAFKVLWPELAANPTDDYPKLVTEKRLVEQIEYKFYRLIIVAEGRHIALPEAQILLHM